MCLRIKPLTKALKALTGPLTAYKVLRVYNDWNSGRRRLTSLFQTDYHWKAGRNKARHADVKTLRPGTTIGSGFIHCYLKKSDAEKRTHGRDNRRLVTVRISPRDFRYYGRHESMGTKEVAVRAAYLTRAEYRAAMARPKAPATY